MVTGPQDPHSTLAHNILFLKILKDIYIACADRGIAVLAIKGCALLGREYPDLARRPMTDIDLLVRRSDFEATGRVLDALGAARAPCESILQQQSYERLYYLNTGQIRVAIDLHHAVAHPQAFTVDYEKVFSEAVAHPLEDIRRVGTRRPSAEHSLLILALHQLYDAFPVESHDFRDAQRLLECNPVDPHRLAAEAERWGAVGALGFFLTRGRELRIVENAQTVLAELRISSFRRRAMRVLLDPAGTDPIRIPVRSKRARQILLFYIFCQRLGTAVRFPLHILRLKVSALFGERLGIGHRERPCRGERPPT